MLTFQALQSKILLFATQDGCSVRDERSYVIVNAEKDLNIQVGRTEKDPVIRIQVGRKEEK